MARRKSTARRKRQAVMVPAIESVQEDMEMREMEAEQEPIAEQEVAKFEKDSDIAGGLLISGLAIVFGIVLLIWALSLGGK